MSFKTDKEIKDQKMEFKVHNNNELEVSLFKIE